MYTGIPHPEVHLPMYTLGIHHPEVDSLPPTLGIPTLR